jgi:hypothetical protein
MGAGLWLSSAVLASSQAWAQTQPPPETQPPLQQQAPPLQVQAPPQQPQPPPPPLTEAPGSPSAPSVEPATPPPARGAQGISLGLRVGWGFPLGSLASGDKLGDNLNGMLPIGLDAGYRFSQAVYVGLFGQLGPAFVSGQVCPPILQCSATDLRAGVEARLALGGLLGLRRIVPVDPWVGVGAGYESMTTHVSALGTESHTTNRGFEFGNIEVGADYTGIEPWRVGAFFTLTLTQYSRLTVAVPTGTSELAVPDPALHLWLIAGLRGSYDF